jgi:hypothetical protein
LGGETPLHALDLLVLQSTGFVDTPDHPARFGVTIVDPQQAWRPGWGLDVERNTSWISGADPIVFPASSVYSLLLVHMAVSGGSADKESLFEAVWEEVYHPLRHDKRIQMTISRLRKKLGDPQLIQTIEGGYRMDPDRRFTLVALRADRKLS